MDRSEGVQKINGSAGMSKKKAGIFLLLFCAVVLLNIAIWNRHGSPDGNIDVYLSASAEEKNEIQIYYGKDTKFSEQDSDKSEYGTETETKTFSVNSASKFLRIDLGEKKSGFVLHDLRARYGDKEVSIPLGEDKKDYVEVSMIRSMEETDEGLKVETSGADPYLVCAVDFSDLAAVIADEAAQKDLVINIILMLILDAVCAVLFVKRDKFMSLPVELYRNRKLIFNLAKNDFKTKYAGSYLGIVWAFIQPIITVLVYWFVFQVGLGAAGVMTRQGIQAPFVLWLLAGLVPWFFFQDSLFGGTNALIEYNYLVKKVVFKISVLPIVKIFSALLVHLFFIAFMVVLYACYGYTPDLYTLQVVYYTFCMFFLVLGICYATCAIVGFFRDLTQIINIVLQVGVWMTPIMWNIDSIPLSPVLVSILKLNPMYYVVNGYRDAMLNKVWFWEHPNMTLEFWGVAVVLFGIGTIIFKRLKVHFADVL